MCTRKIHTHRYHILAQAVVGGLAEVKQERQLSQCPEVVVATPGRFWELARTHAYLSRLETIRHLVVDEADRMLERGHYPELKRLFATLGTLEEDEEELRAKGDGFGHARAFEESVHSGRHRWDIRSGSNKEGEVGSLWSEDSADEIVGMEDDGEEDNSYDDGLSGNITKVPVGTAMVSATRSVSSPARNFSRQTYVFSATLLTRGATGRRQQKRNRNAVHRGASDKNDDGEDESDPVTKIMRRLGVRGDPAVIDMGRRGVERREGEEGTAGCRGDEISVRTVSASDVGTPSLPSTLRLCSIKSLQVRVLTRPWVVGWIYEIPVFKENKNSQSLFLRGWVVSVSCLLTTQAARGGGTDAAISIPSAL